MLACPVTTREFTQSLRPLAASYWGRVEALGQIKGWRSAATMTAEDAAHLAKVERWLRDRNAHHYTFKEKERQGRK